MPPVNRSYLRRKSFRPRRKAFPAPEAGRAELEADLVPRRGMFTPEGVCRSPWWTDACLGHLDVRVSDRDQVERGLTRELSDADLLHGAEGRKFDSRGRLKIFPDHARRIEVDRSSFRAK